MLLTLLWFSVSVYFIYEIKVDYSYDSYDSSNKGVIDTGFFLKKGNEPPAGTGRMTNGLLRWQAFRIVLLFLIRKQW